MTVRDNKDITLRLIRVLEGRTLVFIPDLIDQSVKTTNDILRRSGMYVSMHNRVQLESEIDLLSTGTSISPNIPRPLTPLSPLLADLLARHPLIITVIPLSNRLCNLNLGLCPNCFLVFRLVLLTPGQSALAAKFEEF
jgi:hypothetical protein